MSHSRNSKDIPLSRSLLYIFLSTLIISGSATFGWWYYRYLVNMRFDDENYIIKAIVQTGPEKEQLKTQYLAELLGLSEDKQRNLYSLNLVKGEEALLRSPIIKWASLARVLPSTLYIDYEIRKPLARLKDFYNTAIDKEGVIFPLTPFYTPKNLAEIYLADDEGSKRWRWGDKIEGEKMALALQIFEMLSSERYGPYFQVRRIDVSKAYAESFGQRQVVVILEERSTEKRNDETYFVVRSRILRFGVENYSDAMENYLVLRECLLKYGEDTLEEDLEKKIIREKIQVVDLRIPNLAFLSLSQEDSH